MYRIRSPPAFKKGTVWPGPLTVGRLGGRRRTVSVGGRSVRPTDRFDGIRGEREQADGRFVDLAIEVPTL